MKTRSHRYHLLLTLLLIASVLGGCMVSAPAPAVTAAPATESASLGELTLLTPVPTEEAEPGAEATPTETPEPAAEAGSEEAEPTPDLPTAAPTTPTPAPAATPLPIDENGTYTSKEDVALYLYVYGHLPENFITKREARELGWQSGGLDAYAYGCCIGGDRFGNYEGLLPDKNGRFYTECDIDTLHARSRGAKRIVFSNDGLIYYTGDHYESFTLLYGEE